MPRVTLGQPSPTWPMEGSGPTSSPWRAGSSPWPATESTTKAPLRNTTRQQTPGNFVMKNNLLPMGKRFLWLSLEVCSTEILFLSLSLNCRCWDFSFYAMFAWESFLMLASQGYISEVKISKTPNIIAATLQWLRTQQAQNRHIVTTIIAGLKMWKVDFPLGNGTHDLALHILWGQATLLALYLRHFPVH